MDKSWISDNSLNKEKYIRGVLNFLDFAFAKSSKDGNILCPWKQQNLVFFICSILSQHCLSPSQALLKLVVIIVLVIADSADNCIKTMLCNCKVARVLPHIANCAKNDHSAVLRARFSCGGHLVGWCCKL